MRWLFAFALVAALTRTPGGWAVCLATIAAALWMASGRIGPRTTRLWVGVILAGAIPLAAAITINYLKFHNPYMFPLEDQVWTKLNAHRREVLANNGGTLAGIQFFPSSFFNYFRPDGIRFVDYFPWVTLPPEAARGYGAVLDQSSRTGSVTSFMPLSLLLTVASVPILFRRRVPLEFRYLRLILVGAVLMTGGVMDYGYIAFRYTSEFVPALVIGGAVATIALGGWLGKRAVALRRGFVTVLAVLTVFSIAAEMSVGYAIASSTFRGPELESYLTRQVDLSGATSAFGRLVSQSSSMPHGGRADDLWIRGNCDALYFNSGEAADPWYLVQERDTAVSIRTSPLVAPGTYLLMRDTVRPSNTVSLRVTSHKQAQLVLEGDDGEKLGQLFDLPPDAQIRVGARTLPEYGFAQISSTPGGDVGFLTTSRWDQEHLPVLSSIQAVPAPPVRGLSVALAPTLPLPLCQHIAKAAHVQTPAAD